MNGDLGKIYEAVVDNGNRLAIIETKQAERHEQNTRDIEKLHKTISNVISLKTHVGIQWWFIGATVLGIGALYIRTIS